METGASYLIVYFCFVGCRQLMRYLYTILFFIDTLIFLWLCYLFFHKCDSDGSCRTLMLILSGIGISIFLLVLLLKGYLKLPHGKHRHR